MSKRAPISFVRMYQEPKYGWTMVDVFYQSGRHADKYESEYVPASVRDFMKGTTSKIKFNKVENRKEIVWKIW